MKRALVLGFMITLLTAGHAMSQEGVKIRGAAQEAYTASCVNSSERANRPMCLSEEELLQKLAEAGGDEDQMRQNLEQEGRLQIKQSRYGTIRRIVAPSLSSEKLGRGEDPVDFVLRYLDRNGESFGLSSPRESLALPHVNQMAYGGMTVKFKQYYSLVEVYDSQVMALIGKNGDLLTVHASVIPDDATEETLGSRAELEETLRTPPCEDAMSFSSSEMGPNPVLYENADHGGGQATKLAFRVIGYNEDGAPVERLFEADTCTPFAERSLIHNYSDFASLRFVSPYNWLYFLCIKSTFDGEECDETWPDSTAEDQWNFLHDVRDNVLQDHSWENWLNCHYDETPISGMVGVTPDQEVYFSSFYQSSGDGCGDFVYSRRDQVAFDALAHEQMHNVQDVEDAFGSSNCFSHCLHESTADAMAEMLNDSGDVDWVMGTGLVSAYQRDFEYPDCPSYKWFSVKEYYDGESQDDGPHANHGPIERAAYLLAEGGPDTIHGVSFSSIGLSDTAELYWDILVSSASGQNYEETAQLARTLASDIWGSSSNQLTQVTNVMDAMNIWRTPETVHWTENYITHIPFSRFAPAAVDWTIFIRPLLYKEHWLIYAAGTSTSTPADICWTKGLYDNWHSGACAGLASKYRVLSPVDAVVFDNKIWVFFKPSSSSFMHYFTIDKSYNVSAPVKTLVFGASNPQVTTDGSGIIISFINSANSPVVSYYYNSTWTGYSVPATVNNAIAPTPVYDAASDYLWILYVGTDNKTYVKRADWSCVTSSGGRCWASSGTVPNGSGSEFSVAATGSPAGALWGDELYVSQTILGPPSSTKVIYTDSCFDPTGSACSVGNDCGNAYNLRYIEQIGYQCSYPPTSSWTHSVPRDISTQSPGEFHPYNSKLWLFTSNGTFLKQIWKKASGFEILPNN